VPDAGLQTRRQNAVSVYHSVKLSAFNLASTNMDDCVFCNIVNRTIEAQILFENERLIVIKDILPKAPVHLLIIPKNIF